MDQTANKQNNSTYLSPLTQNKGRTKVHQKKDGNTLPTSLNVDNKMLTKIEKDSLTEYQRFRK